MLEARSTSPSNSSSSTYLNSTSSNSSACSDTRSDASNPPSILHHWKPTRTPYIPTPPHSTRQHVPEGMFPQGSEALRKSISPYPRSHQTGLIIQQHSLDLNDPLLGPWLTKLRLHIRIEVEKSLPNWTSLNLIRRGASLDPRRCARTVPVGVEVGTKPGVRDQEVMDLVARLEEHIEGEAAGLGVRVEFVEEKGKRKVLIEGVAQRAERRCRKMGWSGGGGLGLRVMGIGRESEK
ncbi:MAG: hypothetical protein MMC33_006438 [Icmadophila ericetorum]|nr:hypothetical protein [Icmadophila ericetorum]